MRSIPTPSASISSFGSFDDDFGDGSDLVDLVVLQTNCNFQPTVKMEPNTLQQQQQHQQPQQQQPHATINNNAHTPQAYVYQPVFSPPPQAAPPPMPAPIQQPVPPAAPNHAAPPAAHSHSATLADARSSSGASYGSVDPRVVDLESQLSEKSGEARLLRNKLHALERRMVSEAAARASAMSAASLSSSQIPSSQHQIRKQESEIQSRMHQQIEAVKAEKESTEMQLAEYLKENDQLKRKMEAMEKVQQQLQAQLKQSKAAVANHHAAANDHDNHHHANRSTGAVTHTMQHKPPHMNNSPSFMHPPSALPSLPSAPVPVPSMTIPAGATPMDLTSHHAPAAAWAAPQTRNMIDAPKWTPPAYLTNLLVRPINAEPPTTFAPMPHPHLQTLARLKVELTQHCSPTPTSSDLVDRLSYHVSVALDMVLDSTGPVPCILAPIKQLLIGILAWQHTKAKQPTRTQTVTTPSSTTTPLTTNPSTSLVTAPSKPATPLSSVFDSGSTSEVGVWDRSVRVKLEHNPNGGVATIQNAAAKPSTSTTHQLAHDAASSASLPSSSNPSLRLHTTRDTAQLRLVQGLMLRILHLCMSQNVHALQHVYEELCGTHASQSLIDAPTPPLPTLHDPAQQLVDYWKWRGVPHTTTTNTRDTTTTTTPSTGSSHTDSMSWSTLLSRMFDDAFSRLYADRIERANGSGQSTSATSAAVAASSPALSLLELLTSLLHLTFTNGASGINFVDSSAAANVRRDGDEQIRQTWIPRMTHIIARIQANQAAKYTIHAVNAAHLESRIYMSVSHVLSHWCRFGLLVNPHSSMRDSINILQPASTIVIPGHVKSTSVEASSPCSCDIIQILALYAMRQTEAHPLHDAVTSPPAASSSSSNAEWYDLLLSLLSASHRAHVYHSSHPSSSSSSSASSCPVHSRSWGDRDVDTTLLDSTIALFHLPLAQLRLLIAVIHHATQHLQYCTHQQVSSMMGGTFDMADLYVTRPTSPSLSHACTIPQLSSGLSLISSCLGIRTRRWKAVHTDPRWSAALAACRTHEQAELRLDLMLQQLYEACGDVRQCQRQLRAASKEAEQRIRAGHQRQWEIVVQLATDISTWLMPGA